MSEEVIAKKKGLSGFALKYIAVVLMTIDHIHYMFEFTGKMPIWFSYLGRLAAPLFLFCLVEGFIHTHNRKKYFLKIYLVSIIMGLIRFGFFNVLSPLTRGDGFTPQNAMLSSFVILLPILQGIDWLRQKKILRGLLFVAIPLLLPYIVMYTVYLPLGNVLSMNPEATGASVGLFIANLCNYTVLPLHTAIQDGGTLIVLQGIVLYVFSFSKKKNARVWAYGIFTMAWNICLMVLFGVGLSFESFMMAYEWMEVFSVPIMLCYNGERGKGNGKFFYWYYPLHVYVLYAVSILLFGVLG